VGHLDYFEEARQFMDKDGSRRGVNWIPLSTCA
jgi:hypothetical protein